MATAALAQTAGRLSLALVDSSGVAIAEARVRVTCDELPAFEQLRTSDRKGRLLVTFPDGTKVYRLSIEREGFQPVATEVQAVPDELLRRKMELVSAPARDPVAPPTGADPAIAHNDGVEALRAERFADAIPRFEAALALDPRFVPALVGLALAQLKVGNAGAAAQAAERALAVEPGNLRALGLKIEAARASGDKEGERAALSALERADPRRAAVELVNGAIDRYDSGQIEAAKSLLLKALALDPANPGAHYRLGLCLIAASDLPAAKIHLERFLELAPEAPEAATAREMLRGME